MVFWVLPRVVLTDSYLEASLPLEGAFGGTDLRGYASAIRPAPDMIRNNFSFQILVFRQQTASELQLRVILVKAACHA